MNDPKTTRREFVKAAAALLAAAPLAHAAGDDRIRVGLVGCGGRGTGAATQALDADPGVVIWAMADVFEDKLNASLDELRRHAPAAGRVDVPPERRFLGFDAYRRLIGSGVDYRLHFYSPLKDQGVDLGIDLNGPAPGLYEGAAPDRGGFETW